MTTSSSSIPVLGPVLYFTQTDGYSYDVDNRPLFHLDTNIRHINTSLVGLGYGEHASAGGGLLQPGRAVSLFPNGSIFYPTGTPSTNPSENIVGLVIGATENGLNRVIWSSKHLDLDVLGLGTISAGHASGSYLYTSSGSNGVIQVTSAPNLSTMYIVGRIKSGPYIEINTSTDLISNNAVLSIGNAVKDNHANKYGLHRLRNLLLFVDAGEVPVQFTKVTSRMKDYLTIGGTVNPMNASLSMPSKTSISVGATDTTNYGNSLNNFVVKERYKQFFPESVLCNSVASAWASTSYGTTLPGNTSENYDLQPFNGGKDYNTFINLFKSFTVDKYYQYYSVGVGDNNFGKVKATATVFNPLYVNNPDLGGEQNPLIVFDFYEFDQGFETSHDRIILDSASAIEALKADVAGSGRPIFPATLLTL